MVVSTRLKTWCRAPARLPPVPPRKRLVHRLSQNRHSGNLILNTKQRVAPAHGESFVWIGALARPPPPVPPSQPVVAGSELRGVGAKSLRAPGLRPVAPGASPGWRSRWRGTATRKLPGGLRRDRRKGTGGAAWAMVARRGAGMLTAGQERPAATTENEAKLVFGGRGAGGAATAFRWMRDRGSWIPSWTRRNAGRFRPLSESWR